MSLRRTLSWRPLCAGVVMSVCLADAGAEGFPGMQMLSTGWGPYLNDTGYDKALKVYGTLDAYVDQYDSGSRSGTRFAGGGAWTNKVGLFFRTPLAEDLALQGVVEEGFNFDGDALSHDSGWDNVNRLRLAALALRSPQWGKLELGKTFGMGAPSFVDPFLATAKQSVYTWLSQPVGVKGAYYIDLRPKHSLAYTSPRWNGWGVGSMLTFGFDDAAADGRTLRGEGFKVDYWGRKVMFMASYNRYWSDPFDTATRTNLQVRNDYYSVTGMYDFGPASLSLNWQHQKVFTEDAPLLDVVSLGTMIPVGKDLARAVIVERKVQGADNDALGIMVGYDHFFSPQTAVYVRAGVVFNQSRAGQTYAAIPIENADDTPQDLAVGVYHHF